MTRAGAWAGDATVVFRVADADGALSAVRLIQEAGIPADRLDFIRRAGGWELTATRPPVGRMEYLPEFRYPDGGTKVVTDPANPRQASGAFGPKSVLEFPGYRPPAWLAAPASRGVRTTSELPVLGAVMWGHDVPHNWPSWRAQVAHHLPRCC